MQIHLVDACIYGKSISTMVPIRLFLDRDSSAAISKGRSMSDQPPATKVTGLDKRERLAVEMLYRAFSEGDPDLLDQAVTADWQDIPLAPGQAPGREGMKPLIRGWMAAFPDTQVVIHEIIGVPGRASVRAEITATHKGEWFGIAPTNTAFRMPIHEFHAIEDGKITHTWHLEDWFGWLNQVGAWPQKETV
jgi:predicted ester cyclase